MNKNSIFGKRYKFWPFHFYRKVNGNLAIKMFLREDNYKLTWEEWESKINKICPIQFFIRETIPNFFIMSKYDVRNICYKIKCLFKPYNVLKIRTLPKTYCDEDCLLTHAMFAVLERFMKQNPQEIVDYSWNDEHKEFWQEINIVWNWWNNRDKREREMSEAYELATLPERRFSNDKYKEVEELEKRFHEEEKYALQTIIKYKDFLWI